MTACQDEIKEAGLSGLNFKKLHSNSVQLALLCLALMFYKNKFPPQTAHIYCNGCLQFACFFCFSNQSTFLKKSQTTLLRYRLPLHPSLRCSSLRFWSLHLRGHGKGKLSTTHRTTGFRRQLVHLGCQERDILVHIVKLRQPQKIVSGKLHSFWEGLFSRASTLVI